MKDYGIKQLLEIDIHQLERLLVENLSKKEFEEICSHVKRPSDPSFKSADALFDYTDLILISRALDAWVRSNLYRIQPIIKQKICIDFDYCVRQDKGEFASHNIKILASLVEILCVFLTQIPVTSTVSLAVFIIRKKYLDGLCECNSE